MAFRNILLETADDGIATLTLNRPDKLNALNAELLQELEAAISQVDSDANLRGLILTGAGEKAFAAGADIRELAAADAVGAHEQSLRGQRIFARLETLRKPTVAAIRGYALGGGLELALACMVRICTPDAKLGQPEVKLGIIAGYGATQRLPRLVGRAKALEMLLTGEPIDAAEAHRVGLVNHVVASDALLPHARALLRKIAGNAPVAVALTVQAVDAAFNATMDEGLRYEAAAFAVSAATEDRREGTAAFLEKRAAVFQGK